MKTYLMPMTKVMNLNVNAAILDENLSGTVPPTEDGADAAPFL